MTKQGSSTEFYMSAFRCSETFIPLLMIEFRLTGSQTPEMGHDQENREQVSNWSVWALKNVSHFCWCGRNILESHLKV